jgi:hypothetical protein
MSKKKNNWFVKAVWLITLGPLVIAWTMAYTEFGIPTGTKNNGELQQPGLVVPQALVDEQNGRWGLIVASDACDATCEQEVYRLQQLFISMGKEQERLHAIWLSTQARPTDSDLSVKLDYHYVTYMQDETSFNWFKDNKLAWQDHSIWLVDPLGNLVLRFSPDLTGREMMADINWLLKASRIG